MRVMSGGDLGLLCLRGCAADASQQHNFFFSERKMCLCVSAFIMLHQIIDDVLNLIKNRALETLDKLIALCFHSRPVLWCCGVAVLKC